MLRAPALSMILAFFAAATLSIVLADARRPAQAADLARFAMLSERDADLAQLAREEFAAGGRFAARRRLPSAAGCPLFSKAFFQGCAANAGDARP